MPAQLSLQRTDDKQKMVLDYISDGQWYMRSKIVRAIAKRKTSDFTQSVSDYIDELADGGYLISGANDSYRLKEKYVTQWRKKRGDNLTSTHEPRYFGGMLEDDGWTHAPLKVKQLVHFRADSSVGKRDIVDILSEQTDDFSVSIDEAGLIRVFANDGAVIYRTLQEASKLRPDYHIKGIRLSVNVKRRDREDLPPRFLDDLCEFYGKFSVVLLRKSMSSITAHIQEPEDIQQQIYMWIMDAVERYDETSSIPFAAYLATVMNRWVFNLNRAAHGRSIADSELKHFRAVAKFENDNQRKPSIEELASLLGEPVDKVRQDAFSVNVVTNLRSTSSLNNEDFHTPLIASESSSGEIENDLDKTTLSLSLLSTAATQLGESQGKSAVALFRVIDKTWNHDRRLSSFYKGTSAKVLDEVELELMSGMKTRIEEAYNN